MENYTSEILELLSEELEEIVNKNIDKYKDYHIVISNETSRNEETFYSDKTIYIVVRFMPSYIWNQQSVVSITLKVLSEQNSIDIAQQLMIEFALTYNLRESSDGTIKQVYQTPTVSTNYNEVYTGYRTAMYMTATFVISKYSNPFEIEILEGDTSYDEENPENNKIPSIKTGFSSIIQSDSQPFFHTNGTVSTVGQFRAVGITISTYLLDTKFCNKCLDVALGLNGVSTNAKFKFKIKFKNGREKELDFTMTSFDDSQSIGEFPMVVISFSS